MAEAFVYVKLFDGFVLPYESGAEQYLGELKPWWDELAASYRGLRLDPGFPVEQIGLLAHMVDAARMLGGEPPDPFAWFEVPCEAAQLEALVGLLYALPFVEWAEPRIQNYPAARVAYGTNEDALASKQLRAAPVGIDACYAWRVPGGAGRGIPLADVEHGWNLQHIDLAIVPITPFSVFGAPTQKDIDHGTSALGIVVAGDNGGGIVGIAPQAHAHVVTSMRQDGQHRLDTAIAVAGDAVRPGGVVLIELGSARPWAGDNEPGLPVELSRKVQTTLQLLGFFGITVIEPAGNTGENLDIHHECNHFNPADPGFRDSLAIMVGGATQDPPVAGVYQPWQRGSTFGTRVDCFAAFAGVRAPYDHAPYPYHEFGGTSAASAVIAGVVCAIQGMQAARDGQCLSPTSIRDLLRNPSLCTPAASDPPGNIGGMPDLRKVAVHMGWPRILPAPAAAAIAGDSALLVGLGADDRLSLRIWSRLFGPGPELPQPDSKPFDLSDCQPALLVSLETAPLLRTVFEVLITGVDGSLRYYYWDTLGNTGDIARERTELGSLAPGYDVAACHPLYELTTVAAIQMSGQLVAVEYDATVMGNHDFSDAVQLDAFSTYRRTPGPVMLSRKPRTVDVVAIDDGGALRWISGIVPDGGTTTFWRESVAAQCDVPMEPGVKPGIVGTLDGVAVVAVGSDGLLYGCGFGLQPLLFETLIPIGPAPAFAAEGHLGLALLHDDTLVTVAVSADGLLHAAFRPLVPGGEWTPLLAIDPYTAVSPAGGATVITQGDTVMVFAVLPDGRVCRSDYTPERGWSPLMAG
ncbi:S8 family serine peptidase [Cupriavidus gilardii]|uniref:S8 family serine peptidase n=1 Tax=Cupriavidus gilardii TaxID=82541 RepID=UPI00157FE7DF|nr:S8 family serine peptidase [Cupriavidus gilardii]QKS61427.1 S8 family serine peptidase [Cupriavidus gilardii]